MMELVDVNVTATPALSGFKTAGGKQMKGPSQAAIKRARNMWDEDVQSSLPGKRYFTANTVWSIAVQVAAEKSNGTVIRCIPQQRVKSHIAFSITQTSATTGSLAHSYAQVNGTAPWAHTWFILAPAITRTPEEVLDMTYDGARKHAFKSIAKEDGVGADATRISHAWVENHFQHIVWKAACLYRSYPECSEVWYEREINRRETPAIRMLLEGFELPLLPLVLCVVSVNVPHTGQATVRLTDGWYTITATLDAALVTAYGRGRWRVGDKLAIGHVELLKSAGEVQALQQEELLPVMALGANGVRRARIRPDGGTAPLIDVVIVRKYPMLVMETDSAGHKRFVPFRANIADYEDSQSLLARHPNIARITDAQHDTLLTKLSEHERQKGK
ncbi:BRCA2, oligonucleotide/oligosaccharide-binding, domain 1-domain-containing protein [Thamnocephalis sphaerospora]|uniref:BRCA2, oligonucleotide/oligosaccharide-binding, domain 1-domain-containing protein n=1 Tax=Thamnocephalis sphaerospora TaxID=78915 RepID=A0A4V1IVN2_9FUNG|nr:BRCA2, oligonucleotide/oligosaccharide-binding, domain 1-domain-containing protein [Thamnocephalis sphaerospora]|eukprot:RKP04649.1 BRCA2, oligonucleotide/oligosaccharide-binding, domain 1-domain-containing protein [Thamnocephalis sphaerospora]